MSKDLPLLEEEDEPKNTINFVNEVIKKMYAFLFRFYEFA